MTLITLIRNVVVLSLLSQNTMIKHKQRNLEVGTDAEAVEEHCSLTRSS